MNIKLIYASLTGNTEMLSDLIIEKFEAEKGIEIEKLFIEDMVDFDFLDDADAFIIATYTYGEGELPEEMEELQRRIEEANRELAETQAFETLDESVLGLHLTNDENSTENSEATSTESVDIL